MKQTLIIFVTIILLIICYNLEQFGLAIGIAFYVSGCATMVLFQSMFHTDSDEQDVYKYDEYESDDDYDEPEFYSYLDFLNESNETIWDYFLLDMYDDDTLTFMSDDREKFYNDNIEKYSNQLEKQIKNEYVLGVIFDRHLNN